MTRALSAVFFFSLLSLFPSPEIRAQETGTQLQAQPAPAVSASRDVTDYTLPPEKYAKAQALAREGYTLYGVRVIYGWLVLLGLLAWPVFARRAATTGKPATAGKPGNADKATTANESVTAGKAATAGKPVGARFRDWAERASRRRFVQALIFAPLVLLTLRLLRLPFSIWGHTISLRYELSHQGWASWFWDWTKGAAVNVAVGTLLVWGFYFVVRRSPARWWLWAWLAAVPVIVVGVFLSPLMIDPLFYDYAPLERAQPQLVGEIEKVTRRGGLEIPRERMFEMNASAKLNVANAYVAGLGASKRVVVWDTTVRMLTVPQTLAVFGHEMGHYVLNHIAKGIALSAAGMLVAFWIAFRALRWMLGRWGRRWGVRGADDWASLPAVMLVLSLITFFASPVSNAVSRYIEHEADVYGLEVVHSIVPDTGRADAEAQQILAEAALEDPDPSPYVVWWFYTHPTTRERIRFARAYDPWSQGQSPRFVQ